MQPDEVLAVLRKVVREDLSLNNPAVAHLTHVLNIIQLKVRGELSHEEQKRGWIAALAAQQDWVRDELILPAARQGYAQSSGHPRWPMLEVADAQKKERLLEELREGKRRAEKGLRLEDEKAARHIQEQIAPLEQEVARVGTGPEVSERINSERDDRRRARKAAQPILNKREVKGWHDFAQELRTVFHAELPEQFDEAAHQFIAEVTPYITNEHPVAGTVKKYLSRAQRTKKGTSAKRMSLPD